MLDTILTGNWVAFSDGLQHLVLPAVTLAAYPLGLIARMTRAAMLDALSQDYVFTARAYGLRERQVLWVLALRNALPPTLTITGLATAYAHHRHVLRRGGLQLARASASTRRRRCSPSTTR